MSTLRTVLQEVAKRHYSFVLPDTVSGINVEMDEVAQPLDQHRMVIHKDVCEQGQISTTTDGRYYLRRQIHLAFLSKIRLDERGIQRDDAIDELLYRTYAYLLDLINTLDEQGIVLYASPIYTVMTNQKDANLNLVDVQLFIEEPEQHCYANIDGEL